MCNKTVIVLNGDIKDDREEEYKSIIEQGEVLIAADGGLKLLLMLNYIPHLIIGDLDSVEEKKVNKYKGKYTKILKFSSEKDETDGELALTYCAENNINNIVLTNTLGGRLDHQLANIFLLEYAVSRGLKAVIREPGLEIGIIDRQKTFNNYRGNILSILPLSKEVINVSNTGFKYPLNGDKLLRYKTRGLSNIISSKNAGISLDKGKLLYILEI